MWVEIREIRIKRIHLLRNRNTYGTVHSLFRNYLQDAVPEP